MKYFIRTFARPVQDSSDLHLITANLDQAVNEWAKSCDGHILSVAPMVHQQQLVYVVTCVDEIGTTEVRKAPDVLEELPVAPGARAPTVQAVQVIGDKQRNAHPMCGVFPAIEGAPLVTDDIEPAPVPVFSPDFDITIYQDWFGNTGG